jgi:cell division protease FtsH
VPFSSSKPDNELRFPAPPRDGFVESDATKNTGIGLDATKYIGAGPDAKTSAGENKIPAAPPNDPSKNRNSSTEPNFKKWIPLAVLLLLVNWFAATSVRGQKTKRTLIPYSAFTEQVVKGNVVSISSRGATIQGEFRKKSTNLPAKAAEVASAFRTERPAFANDDLLALLKQHGVIVKAEPIDVPVSIWIQLLTGIGPTLLIIGLMVWFLRRGMGAASGLGGLGRTKAELYVPKEHPTTFADVAGIDEVVNDMREIVDFLKNPQRYQALGGMIPKGVLLTGSPGTGKTLLARALAGEANVPFFAMSASEFVEMIVGVGASRVRDLFEKARAAAPSIIFIDELDAIGRARGGAVSFGGHDEREQTLNQILTEMDGFSGSEGVIVIAATNRSEVLDPALLRPGRFDRHVVVNAPDVIGREAILRVHTRKVPLEQNVRLHVIASITPGMVGADLRNLVNEAALLAARNNKSEVDASDFSNALERIQLGAERQIVMSLEDRTHTAVHEAGHALLGMLQPGADPVRKISIIPRGRALGVTYQSPDRDRYSVSSTYLRGRIIGALGGRAAEQLKFGDVTTGAESDLMVATSIARQMVARWGMSDEIGPVSIEPEQGDEHFSPFGGSTISDHTRELVDAAISRLIDSCQTEAHQILAAHEQQLQTLVDALLIHETLDEVDAYRVAGVDHPSNSTADFGRQVLSAG